MSKHNKAFKRFLSIMMTLVLCLAVSMTSFATGDGEAMQDDSRIKEQAADTSADPITGETTDTLSNEETNGQESFNPEGTTDPADLSDDGIEEPRSTGEDETENPVGTGEEETENSVSTGEEETEDSVSTGDDGKGEPGNTDSSSSDDPEAADPTADDDFDMDGMLELIRETFDEETAQLFEKLMNNENVKELAVYMETQLKEAFPGMTDEQIAEKLETMTDEEMEALMEELFETDEAAELLEAIMNDEELNTEIEKWLEKMFGDTGDITGEELKEPVSGKQGSSVTWNLATDGTLTISGTGAIEPEYVEYEGTKLAFYEWDEYCDNIKKVVVKDGITNIPEDAFLWADGLKTVFLPASVTSVGSCAFAACENLSAVYFQGNAPAIAEDAFEDCSKDLTLYYLEGTTGWDKLSGRYKLAVWNKSSQGTNNESEETKATETDKNTSTNQSDATKKRTEAAGANKGTPSTGDTATPYIFIILMAAALACGGLIVVRMRKRK